MKVNEERKYVIVCNEHKAVIKEALLFWGSLTDDSAERSFSGYTCQIDKCERYTREELKKWRGNLIKEYPFYDELKNRRHDFYKKDEVLITIDELKAMGYKEFRVMAL